MEYLLQALLSDPLLLPEDKEQINLVKSNKHISHLGPIPGMVEPAKMNFDRWHEHNGVSG